jgi:plasmid stabilization system protein ParE
VRPTGAAVAAIEVIIDGVEILERHPLVGRSCEAGLRELIISYGKTRYIALYSYESAQDVVLILAIRHQREAGLQEAPWKMPVAGFSTGVKTKQAARQMQAQDRV